MNRVIHQVLTFGGTFARDTIESFLSALAFPGGTSTAAFPIAAIRYSGADGMSSRMSHDRYLETRFGYLERRSVLWRTLYRYHFSRFIKPSFHVLDLGAAYCDFINAVQCDRRTAVDVWEGTNSMRSKVSRSVFSPSPIWISSTHNRSILLASNLFEHLSRSELTECLKTLREKMKPAGTLAIIQPNFKYAYREYFDDYTHVTIYTEKGLSDLLEAKGLGLRNVTGGFCHCP